MKKIILVDDSLLDRKLLSRFLVNAGVRNEILQTDNGEAALVLIAENLGEVGLILLDYQMPRMSGIEVMRALAGVATTADLPVIMITASSSEESKQTAYGVNPRLAGYVIKPFKPELLLAALRPYVQFHDR